MSTKILTIDDSKTIRMIVAKAFKPFDCAILEGANGIEGLAVAIKEKPDLIILDITMPVMDGYETLTKLRHEAELKNIPVIMLTAEAGRDNVLRIAKLGVRGYIIKPFKEVELLEKVGKIVKLVPRAQPAGPVKSYLDSLDILVVDDKPAIIEQIQEALSQTPWKVQGVGDAKTALDRCTHQPPDALLISLSLPDGGGLRLFQSIAANPQTQSISMLGLSVKTATAEQEQAQKAGFAALVTKPIDPAGLHDKLVETLRLDTSYRYFQQVDDVLALNTPVSLTSTASDDILRLLEKKVAGFVETGMVKVIINFSKTRDVDWKLVKIGLKAVALCKELGLRYCLVGSDEFGKACEDYPEAISLPFVYNWNDAVRSLTRKVEEELA
jgi:two-component system cell cycle response regulator